MLNHLETISIEYTDHDTGFVEINLGKKSRDSLLKKSAEKVKSVLRCPNFGSILQLSPQTKYLNFQENKDFFDLRVTPGCYELYAESCPEFGKLKTTIDWFPEAIGLLGYDQLLDFKDSRTNKFAETDFSRLNRYSIDEFTTECIQYFEYYLNANDIIGALNGNQITLRNHDAKKMYAHFFALLDHFLTNEKISDLLNFDEKGLPQTIIKDGKFIGGKKRDGFMGMIQSLLSKSYGSLQSNGKNSLLYGMRLSGVHHNLNTIEGLELLHYLNTKDAENSKTYFKKRYFAKVNPDYL